MTLLFRVGVFVAALLTATAMPPSGNELPPGKPLSAPTYYIASEVVGCEPDPNYVEFRGATNLPSSAMIGVQVVDPADGGKSYSDEMYVPVVEPGFFAGEIPPRKGMHFHFGLALQVVFTPFRPKQPDSVLRVVGKKAEKLQQVPNVRLKVSNDFTRPAANPQLIHWSGDTYGLGTTAIVPNCGEKH